MNDCSEVLGIAADASLQDIKRAYARALKSNRPDDDPEAFARVHEAFEACVARFQRRQAGIEDEDDYEWFDDENEGEQSGEAERNDDDGYFEMATAGAAPTPVEFEVQPLPEPIRSEVVEAVDAIFEAAATLPTGEFIAWLRSDERLYDLTLKRDAGELAIHRLSGVAEAMHWRTIEAIFQFFEVDSIADRRLRSDYLAREVWLGVQADARFAAKVGKMRTPYTDFAETIALAELLDPPDRKRHLKMHLVPTLPRQLRRKFMELDKEDPERAAAAISEHARDYWLPLTDPTRLPLRRIALALFHFAAMALPLALLLSTSNFSLVGLLQVWGTIFVIFFLMWFGITLFSFVTARYSAWRLRTVGAGEAPAGANPWADRTTAIAGACSLASLVLAGLAMASAKEAMGTIPQVWAVMFTAIVMFRGPRFRWESMLSVVAVAMLAYAPIRGLGADTLEDPFFAAGPAAFSTGVLLSLLVDIVHGRLTRQALVDVRDVVSIPQCLVAVGAVLLNWFT